MVFSRSGFRPEHGAQFPADPFSAELRRETSHWEPEWSTTLVYDGDAKILNGFLAELNRIEGFQIRITVSPDLSKETGSALQAGSWWVKYSHTAPDTVTVRINLAAEKLRGDLLEIILPKGKIKDDGGK
jgi:hypothetical protein